MDSFLEKFLKEETFETLEGRVSSSSLYTAFRHYLWERNLVKEWGSEVKSSQKLSAWMKIHHPEWPIKHFQHANCYVGLALKSQPPSPKKAKPEGTYYQRHKEEQKAKQKERYQTVKKFRQLMNNLTPEQYEKWSNKTENLDRNPQAARSRENVDGKKTLEKKKNVVCWVLKDPQAARSRENVDWKKTSEESLKAVQVRLRKFWAQRQQDKQGLSVASMVRYDEDTQNKLKAAGVDWIELEDVPAALTVFDLSLYEKARQWTEELDLEHHQRLAYLWDEMQAEPQSRQAIIKQMVGLEQAFLKVPQVEPPIPPMVDNHHAQEEDLNKWESWHSHQEFRCQNFYSTAVPLGVELLFKKELKSSAEEVLLAKERLSYLERRKQEVNAIVPVESKKDQLERTLPPRWLSNNVLERYANRQKDLCCSLLRGGLHAREAEEKLVALEKWFQNIQADPEPIVGINYEGKISLQKFEQWKVWAQKEIHKIQTGFSHQTFPQIAVVLQKHFQPANPAEIKRKVEAIKKKRVEYEAREKDPSL